MNMRLVAPAFALLFAAAGCGTNVPGTGTDTDTRPPWLLQLIAQQEAAPVANPPAYIALREYGAGVYYYLPSRCCDIYSNLYDAEGALVCHPDGGITGGGSGNCPALGTPIREEIVWRDERTP
jgi:hypothetical protein